MLAAVPQQPSEEMHLGLKNKSHSAWQWRSTPVLGGRQSQMVARNRIVSGRGALVGLGQGSGQRGAMTVSRMSIGSVVSGTIHIRLKFITYVKEYTFQRKCNRRTSSFVIE